MLLHNSLTKVTSILVWESAVVTRQKYRNHHLGSNTSGSCSRPALTEEAWTIRRTAHAKQNCPPLSPHARTHARTHACTHSHIIRKSRIFCQQRGRFQEGRQNNDICTYDPANGPQRHTEASTIPYSAVFVIKLRTRCALCVRWGLR